MTLSLRVLAAALAVLTLALLIFVVNVLVGMRAHARYGGNVSGLPLRGPVSVLRDARGVPHIIAQNDHDLFFAQGYVEGSDRLFQMDLLRRFTLGELAEVFASGALATDKEERAIPIRAIVQAQWRRLDPVSREILAAFSDGVNAAMNHEPLPVEFRLLVYRPRAWTPQDSLAVGMATVLDLIDNWNAIAARDAAYRRGGLRLLDARFPLTDRCYDAPVLAGLRGVAKGPRCERHLRTALSELEDGRTPLGSNAWAAGATHSLTSRALLANDPHLGLGIPGVWYLIDLRSPTYHAAGASLPGLPAVVLGHNEKLAWGVTAGSVTSLSVFLPPAKLNRRSWQTERFAVRFRSSASARYYRTAHEFGLQTRDNRFVLVRWNAYDHPASPETNFISLGRATSIEAAIAALSSFPGPSLNFALADSRGRVAYLLAGKIPDDPVRARWFHTAADLSRTYPMIPFRRLPRVAPSRSAIVWSANNKMYGENYPRQLSPQFAPPYRAYRIAQLLRARPKYDVMYFMQMQMDVLSLPELALARDLVPELVRRQANLAGELEQWNGEVDGGSRAATVIVGLRSQLTLHHSDRMPTLLATAPAIAALSRAITIPSPLPWRIAGAVTVQHSLSKLGCSFLNGTTLPGYGDPFTLHVQTPGYSQSFRAVWDVGDWDAGGITLPQGESGEPGSGHYTDEAIAWVSGRLLTLPFSSGAVKRAAVYREMLLP